LLPQREFVVLASCHAANESEAQLITYVDSNGTPVTWWNMRKEDCSERAEGA
jgi:hypothetical protein